MIKNCNHPIEELGRDLGVCDIYALAEPFTRWLSTFTCRCPLLSCGFQYVYIQPSCEIQKRLPLHLRISNRARTYFTDAI